MATISELYERETEVSTLDIDVPAWIDSEITTYDVAAIVEGGCASGAYMPAVVYHKALETISAHGDDVLEYIEQAMGEIPAPPDGSSWSGIACHYLSMAVELWASSVADEIEFEEE